MRLFSVLIKKRPEMRLGISKPDNKALKFIKRQIHWMSQGYTEEKAFEKTEIELAKNLHEARSHSAMLYEIGTSTSIRSFLNHYEQVAEYQGRLKVKQLVRDLPKHIRSTKEYDIFEEHQYMNEWEKLTMKFTSVDHKNSQPQKSFISKAQTLIEYHQEKADKYDGIQGLSDDIILWSARDAYRHLKKTSNDLLKRLQDLGVKIDEKGELDVSSIENKDLQQAIKLNPMITSIFKQSYTEAYPQENEAETEGPNPGSGNLKAPEIKWKSENPYKQIFLTDSAGNISTNKETVGTSNPIETQEERIKRLQRLWHYSRRNKTANEQFKLQQDAVKALRSIRMKVDQIIVSNGGEAEFSKNKAYTKDELLRTHKLDIEKMAKFLATDKKHLIETELDKVEYEEIHKMIRQKTVFENITVGPEFGPRPNKFPENVDSTESEEEEEEDEEKKKKEYRGINLKEKLVYEQNDLTLSRIPRRANKDKGKN
jgi:hypothetical protein